MKWLFCAIALWTFATRASNARADDAVLLLETPGLRPGLCAALRIQLTDLADVRCHREESPGPLSARIVAAALAVRSAGVRLGVLLERDPDPAQLRMLLVGADSGQAVLAIERIEDRPAPDVDRSLALEVRDALEVIMAADTRASAVSSAQASAPVTAVLVDPARAHGPRMRVLVEAGGGGMFGAYARGAGHFALGVGARRAHYQGEVLLTAQVLSTLHVRKGEGRVREDEWGGALSLRGWRALGRVSLGLEGALGFSRISALGTTGDGSSGSARLALVRGAVGLDLRLALGVGIALRLAPALELFPVAQRFSVDQRVITDLGRVRVLVPLSLLLALATPKAEGR